ncbi:hypothetical protein [Nocardiopsis tropica]|uniref:6-phosphogluconate dehydrogenase C-terminal domain-containing protein n=1 Tax=Nocardiopsis tropica TaxID=109330 RepID=A0ABV1ZYA3_9ACTN
MTRSSASHCVTPGFPAAPAYFDELRAERLPAALFQGRRDRFGAHAHRRAGVFRALRAGPLRGARGRVGPCGGDGGGRPSPAGVSRAGRRGPRPVPRPGSRPGR